MATDTTTLAFQVLNLIPPAASAIAAYLSLQVAQENKALAQQNLRLADENREAARQSVNRTAAAKYEEQIARHPQLLELHGFSHQKLAGLGLTPVEVAYLLASFTAGDLYYQDGRITELTQYRQVLLQSERVQTAWREVLKGKLIGPGPFCTMVDAFIAAHPPTRK